jgi:anti-sigma regulatory factor (Ser/Thr protein kinase)
MKLKLLTVILVLAALFSVVLWRVDRFVYGNRMAWAESQARSQVSSVSQAITTEIKSGRRMLSTVNADTFRPEKTNWRAFQPYYALALMTSQNGAMSISRMVTKADSPAASWNAVQLSQYMGFLGKELESRSAVILRSFKDRQKKPHVALIFAGGGTAYILIGSGENFQALIDSQKGSMSSFSIMAGDGLTISHPVPDYIGNVMSDSTLLKEIRSKGAAQGMGIFLQGKTSVFGMYEKVAGTNSYVISTVPLEDLLRGRLSLAWQFVFLILGFSLLGSALYFWYEKKQGLAPALGANGAAAQGVPTPAMSPPAAAAAAPMKKTSAAAPPLQPPPRGAPSPAAGPMIPASHAAAVVLSNEALIAPSAPRTANTAMTSPKPLALAVPEEPTADKAEAYRHVASALGQEMRAPIASILGFSQMVLSKTQDPDVVQAVESILREARSSRDVLEKLQTFSGEHASVKFEGKLEAPLGQALKNFENLFRDKGVTVEKDFKNTSPWPLSMADMTKVFENIFSNAVEAMERMQNKLLKISVWEDGQGLHTLISDTGEGIAPENLQKIFDPFYTTRSFAHHVGLGLPVVFGILKEHHAEIQIKSARGQGTQVEILFLPIAKSSFEAAPMSAPPPKDVLAAPVQAVLASEPAEVTAPAPARQKLTDVNVDKLLDFSNDETPLEFLDGLGFNDEDSENIGRAPPAGAIPEPTPPPESSKPKAPPPPTAAPTRLEAPQDDEVTDPMYQMEKNETLPEEEFVAGPKPSLPARAPAIIPPEFRADGQGPVATPVETVAPPTPPPPPTVTIDPPKLHSVAKPSALDSYKVEIRRPGKRT